jgi:hypothetical protein
MMRSQAKLGALLIKSTCQDTLLASEWCRSRSSQESVRLFWATSSKRAGVSAGLPKQMALHNHYPSDEQTTRAKLPVS